ncbi:hypothetical protein JCGZ_13591 [Jatropha curcas]|uniref:Uncharacterized protein n=1 Tax=Jatropha curcas TaxID=180498 RepID=A0A067KA87_JATCU|nr:hypothetical protein JCGZ_13591 [Jatropha curcas]
MRSHWKRRNDKVANATYTPEDSEGIKTQVASVTFSCASASSTPESQRLYKQTSRARHSAARAREALKRGREFLSTSRERDPEPRTSRAQVMFPGDANCCPFTRKSCLPMHRSGLFPREAT